MSLPNSVVFGSRRTGVRPLLYRAASGDNTRRMWNGRRPKPMS
jgi:hypothetical protein